MVVETPVPVEVSISDERQKEDITRRIQKYLQQQGEPQDDVFPEYVFVMISNRKTKEQVMGEVNPFLGDKAYEFVDWLWRELGSKAHKSPAQKEAPQSVFRHIQTHERDNRPKSIVSVVPKSDAMHDDSEEPEPFISARLFGRSLHTIKHQAEKMPTRARKISPQAMRSRQHAKVEAQTENSGGRDLRQRIREIQETQHSELASDRRQQLLDAQRGLGPGPLLPKPFSPNSQSPPLLPLAPSGGANMGLMRLGPVLEPGVRPGGAGSGMGMGPAAGQGRGLESGTRVGPGRGDGMQMGPGMGMGMGMGMGPGMGMGMGMDGFRAGMMGAGMDMGMMGMMGSGGADTIVRSLSGDAETTKVTKTIMERCRFWPNCREGESCEYVHPSEPCKMFPKCRFGDKCIYVHPNIKCKFGASCTRPDCAYNHPHLDSGMPGMTPIVLGGGRGRGRGGPPANAATIDCRFGARCTRPGCAYRHQLSPETPVSKNRVYVNPAFQTAMEAS